MDRAPRPKYPGVMPKLAPFARQGKLVAGRKILITGASSGIGRALAEAFLIDGAAVAVCARREPLLETLCPRMAEWEGRIAVNAVDPGTARTAMNPSAEDEPACVYPVVRALVAAGADGPTGRCFKKSGDEVAWSV